MLTCKEAVGVDEPIQAGLRGPARSAPGGVLSSAHRLLVLVASSAGVHWNLAYASVAGPVLRDPVELAGPIYSH